jgi:hypothetical protein
MADMVALFSNVGTHVPFFKKEQMHKAIPESLVSMLSYRLTTFMLLAFMAMVTCPEWISGKGNFIDCMHGGSLPDDVINRYCYIQGTFIVPRHVTGSETHREGDRVSHGNDNSQTGVGPYDPRPRNQGGDEIVVKAYYQWVPFFLLLQALMFYAPHLIYKLAEGGRVKEILGSLNIFVLDKEKRKSAESDLAGYFVQTMAESGDNNFWGIKILISQSLYLINVIMQIYFTNVFLGYEFTTYGASARSFLEQGMGREYHSTDDDRVDPMARVFPRVTKCTFHKYGPSGQIQRHDAQCILPINILNEKIFVFLWFWFIILAVMTAIDLLHKWSQAFLPMVRWIVLNRKMRTLPKFKAEELRGNINLRLIVSNLSHGDWQLMYALIRNMDGITFAEWLKELTELLEEKKGVPGDGQAAAAAPLLPGMRQMLNVT